MSEINVSTLKCPACSKPLKNFDGRSSVVKCEDCENIVVVSGNIVSNIDVPERIVPFVKTVEEFETQIEELFINEDFMPRDIFERVSFDDVRPIYLPMFLYEGRYYADWDCELARDEKYVGTNYDGTKVKEKTRTVWYPHSGTTRGGFAILALAYEGEGLPKELASFARTFPYEVQMSKAYDPSYLSKVKDLLVLSHNLDKEATWNTYAIAEIDRVAQHSVIGQLGKKKIKNLNTNVMFEGQPESRLAFIPFWFVYFDYMGVKYNVIMDGLGKNISHLTPRDPITIAETKKISALSTYSLIAAIVLSVSILFIPMDSIIIWILIAVLFGGHFVFKFINNNKIKKVIEHARELRKQGLKNIQG